MREDGFVWAGGLHVFAHSGRHMRLLSAIVCLRLTAPSSLPRPPPTPTSSPQSFKAVQAGLTLNLDSSFAAFMSARPLPELLAEGAGVRGGPAQLAAADPHRLRAAARGLAGFKASGWDLGGGEGKGRDLGILGRKAGW